jgi:hypothetical protein
MTVDHDYMLEAHDVDPRLSATSDSATPIGCWVTGGTAEEILDSAWDDDFLLIGARLRPAFGSLVSLDEVRPAYIVELGHADVEVTVLRTHREDSKTNVICRGKAHGQRESLVALPMTEAGAARLPAAVLAAARRAGAAQSTRHRDSTPI